MSHMSRVIAAALGAAVLLVTPALAQERGPGFSSSVTIATIGSGEADLGDDDSIRWQRSVIGANLQWATPQRLSFGADVLLGKTSYDFDTFLGDGAVDINEVTLALPFSMPVGQTGRLFVAPRASYHGEDGVETADGTSYGLIAGIGWRAAPTLFIGPGFGVSSNLRDDTDPSVFPILVLDWEFAEAWSLSTGAGFAATRGPGLRLAYAPEGDWEFGLEARVEEFEFGLEDGGVGRDRHVPVVLTARYAPTEQINLSAFAGVALAGELSVYDEDGDEVYDESYESVPLFGLAALFRF